MIVLGSINSQDSEDNVFQSNSDYLSSEQSETPSGPSTPASASASVEPPPAAEPQQQPTKETYADAESDGDDAGDGQMGESSVPPWLQAVSNLFKKKLLSSNLFLLKRFFSYTFASINPALMHRTLSNLHLELAPYVFVSNQFLLSVYGKN